MKKTTLCLAVLLLLAISLTSCMKIPVPYEPAYGTDGIASVKVYYIESDNGFYSYEEFKPEEQATASREIPSDQYDELFTDLKALSFKRFIPLLPIPMDPNFFICDYVLVITYEDGRYEYIDPDGVQCWSDNAENSQGSHLSCPDEEWDSFISKYAPDLGTAATTE